MRIQVKIYTALLLLAALAIMACSPGGWGNPALTYTVTFDSQDATVEADPTSITVPSGQTVGTLPTEPTKTDYTFEGWYTEIDGGGTEFTASTTVTANVTVYAKWTQTTYAIGDTGPGGGIVFYVTADGMSGLEAAPVTWNGGSTDPDSPWSNVTSTAVGTTGTALGTGLANSNAIIAQGGHTASAALICRNYTGGSYTDWYLPSRDELLEVYAQRAYIGGLYTTDAYWSSTEANATDGILVQNADGVAANMGKNVTEWVRPIRYFGTTLLVTEYLNDGFEEGSIGGGWLNLTTNGGIYWTIVNTSAHPSGIAPRSGSYMARFWSYSYSSGTAARIYRSSGFTIPSPITSVTLTFYMYHDTGYTGSADRVQVQVSTNGGSDWADVASVINRYDGSTGWKQHTIDLSAYAGQTVVLGFLGTSAYGNDIYLDDVLVTGKN